MCIYIYIYIIYIYICAVPGAHTAQESRLAARAFRTKGGWPVGPRRGSRPTQSTAPPPAHCSLSAATSGAGRTRGSGSSLRSPRACWQGSRVNPIYLYLSRSIYIYPYIYKHIHTHTHTHTQKHTHKQTHTHIHTQTHTHTHIYIYIYIYIYTYIYGSGF